jgi:hypothetical protein
MYHFVDSFSNRRSLKCNCAQSRDTVRDTLPIKYSTRSEPATEDGVQTLLTDVDATRLTNLTNYTRSKNGAVIIKCICNQVNCLILGKKINNNILRIGLWDIALADDI